MTPLLFMSGDEIASEFGGDVNASVAAMMLLHAKEVRESVQTARSLEEENLQRQEENQIRSMHEEADKTRAAGFEEGFGLLISGGLQMASGGVSIFGPTTEAGELTKGAKGTQDILRGAGEGTRGGTQLLATADKGAADGAKADATDAEHRADAAKRRLSDLKDEAADARELAKKAIDFLRDQTRTNASTDQAAANIRG
jgi:hypothetical protein